MSRIGKGKGMQLSDTIIICKSMLANESFHFINRHFTEKMINPQNNILCLIVHKRFNNLHFILISKLGKNRICDVLILDICNALIITFMNYILTHMSVINTFNY